jgi:hypothetical protein
MITRPSQAERRLAFVEPLHGILSLDKPLGFSSMKAVAIVRRRAGGARTGHAGTLDPLATGVLVLALGKCTRQIESLMATEKRYLTTIDMTAFTTTDDVEGERTEVVLGTPGARAAAPTRAEIEALLAVRIAVATGPSRASGMLASHYAPRCAVLVAGDAAEVATLAARHPGALVIGEGTDLVDYARSLYDWLRQADDEHRPAVVAVMPPAAGLGHAIRDRLLKAAADRAG